MLERRPILLNGLRLTLSRPGALLWTYAINLSLALLFSLRVHARFSALLNHSLASQRLTSGFDLGTLIPALLHLSNHTAAGGVADYAGVPLYVVVYFILVPGTLFSYITGAPARLSVLAGEGIAFFWRFVRITLLTVLISALLLVPLVLAEGAWSRWLSESRTGTEVYFLRLAGIAIIALVACLLRLYFDLVEVYTVQLGQWTLPSGRADRRVLRTLKPAFRTLRRNFGRAYFTFVLLAAGSLAIMLFLTRIAVHMLAQPRAWPMFLLAQTGLFLMLAARFWQRGAETILAQDYPVLLPATVETTQVASAEPALNVMHEPLVEDPLPSAEPQVAPYGNDAYDFIDPLPDPEPISPSLPEADPGVFRRDPPERL